MGDGMNFPPVGDSTAPNVPTPMYSEVHEKYLIHYISTLISFLFIILAELSILG